MLQRETAVELAESSLTVVMTPAVVSVGWSLTAVTLMVDVAVPVAAPVLSELESVSDQVMVREDLEPLLVGSSEELEKATERRRV